MAVQSLNQFEKNVGVSFSYVKKDLLMANDAIGDLKTEVQHLSLNQASLLGEISFLKREINDLRDEVKKKASSSSKAKKRQIKY